MTPSRRDALALFPFAALAAAVPSAALADDAMTNREVIDSVFTQLWRERDMSAIERWHAEDYRNHLIDPAMGFSDRLDGMSVILTMFFTAFEETDLVAVQQVSEGDLIFTLCTFSATHKGEIQGVPATGREVEMRVMRLDRIRDGKISDHWSHPDFQGLMRQITA